MLTRLVIRNFKRFEEAEISLGQPVVLIGPNNSGKTTALQALALWEVGLRGWHEKHGTKQPGKKLPKKRPGVTINRRDITSIPVPSAVLLWRDLYVRNVERGAGKIVKVKNVRVEVVVDGVTEGKGWSCGLEFDYANPEFFYCRPLGAGRPDAGVDVPGQAGQVRMAFLPPMSGLADREFIKQRGEIEFLIGQGQTAQVLRNLCYQVHSHPKTGALHWKELAGHIKRLFGVVLAPPKVLTERSQIVMEYDDNGTKLDLSSAGRGLQQTLLLLAHLYANPATVLLLDEPDAHLEILRQREIFRLLTNVAQEQGSQIVAASHSEVVLNEAAGKAMVVAFLGRPHIINDKSDQLLKALTEIGWEDYFQAEETGWVLYLEGPSDLDILQAFARISNHKDAQERLARPFVHYVSTNIPELARDHFFGLQAAKPDLVAVALFDRIKGPLQSHPLLHEMMWKKREIENYLCVEEALVRYARALPGSESLWSETCEKAMRETLGEIGNAIVKLKGVTPWSDDIKTSDEFLEPLFRDFFKRLEQPLGIRKNEFWKLAGFLTKENIDSEVVEKLDAIVALARKSKPAKS